MSDGSLRSRGRVVGLIVGIACVVLAASALQADPLGGLTFADLPIDNAMILGFVLAELAVVGMEGFAYRKLLNLGRPYVTSWVANAASAVLGLVFLNQKRPSLLLAIGLMLAVELPIVWAMNRHYQSPRRLLAIATAVNLVSFFIGLGLTLALGVVIFIIMFESAS